MAENTPSVLQTAQPDRGAAGGELFGHPRGLAILFTTEMWERFSYYGMRALLVLYMTKYVLLPAQAGNVVGLAGFRSVLEAMFGPLDVQPLASQIYGLYTAFVYLTPIFGGLLADRLVGQRRMVVIGAALMAIGHFLMAVESLLLFALLALILGNGAFKPNISTQVGFLYPPGDDRRDRAFSIFYVGINIGAFLAPLVCGTLGEKAGWHYGFAAAGVGMLIGLSIYLYAAPLLPPDALQKAKAAPAGRAALDRDEWAGVLAILALFVPTALFWATYEQAGNTIALWADSQYRSRDQSSRYDGGHPDHLVSGVQSVHDFRLLAVCRGAVVLAGGPRIGAFDRHQDGARLLRRGFVLFDHGAGRLACRRRQGDLALVVRLFRRHHYRRALSVTGRAVARDQGGAAAHAFDDDGGMAGDQLHRRLPGRMARQFLEPHGQA